MVRLTSFRKRHPDKIGMSISHTLHIAAMVSIAGSSGLSPAEPRWVFRILYPTAHQSAPTYLSESVWEKSSPLDTA